MVQNLFGPIIKVIYFQVYIHALIEEQLELYHRLAAVLYREENSLFGTCFDGYLSEVLKG